MVKFQKNIIIIVFLFISNFLYSQLDSSATDKWMVFSIERMPQYAGGEDGLLRFIDAQINYDSIGQIKTEQIVFISCLVDTSGNTLSHFVLKGTREDLNKEALRVTRLIKFEKPALQKGRPIEVKYTIPITFDPKQLKLQNNIK